MIMGKILFLAFHYSFQFIYSCNLVGGQSLGSRNESTGNFDGLLGQLQIGVKYSKHFYYNFWWWYCIENWLYCYAIVLSAERYKGGFHSHAGHARGHHDNPVILQHQFGFYRRKHFLYVHYDSLRSMDWVHMFIRVIRHGDISWIMGTETALFWTVEHYLCFLGSRQLSNYVYVHSDSITGCHAMFIFRRIIRNQFYEQWLSNIR